MQYLIEWSANCKPYFFEFEFVDKCGCNYRKYYKILFIIATNTVSPYFKNLMP